MIVDDHADMRRVLGNIVSLALNDPVELIECESGEQAIEEYTSTHPDCVLMDLQLQNMNGFEVTELIYKLDAKAKVVIVTSFDTPSFRTRAKELNTYGFICKDNLSDLHQLLKNMRT